MTKLFDFIKRNSWLLLIAFLSYVILCLIAPKTGFTADLDCWKLWSEQMRLGGIAMAYHAGANYFPLYLYFLYIYSAAQSSISGIADNLILLKYITLIFDVAG